MYNSQAFPNTIGEIYFFKAVLLDLSYGLITFEVYYQIYRVTETFWQYFIYYSENVRDWLAFARYDRTG